MNKNKYGCTRNNKGHKGAIPFVYEWVVSQSMREKGIDYKLNFGIEYPRIKEIAADYPCSHELAQALWKENIRECKIMAGLLQPVDGFCREIAEYG